MIQKKICILGASAVGKTSLIKQYVEGIFSDKYLTSIGVKIDKKRILLDHADVQLMLWDIEGVDRYAGFNPKYLRGASIVIIVVDQSRLQSLHDGQEIARMTKAEKDIPIVLVVNKSDLPATDGWDSVLENENQSFFETTFQTSAKQNSGVENMFLDVAQRSLY